MQQDLKFRTSVEGQVHLTRSERKKAGELTSSPACMDGNYLGGRRCSFLCVNLSLTTGRFGFKGPDSLFTFAAFDFVDIGVTSKQEGQ